MANLERKYIITMRKDFKKVPYYLRARKAVKVVRAFLQQHMKNEDVKLGPYLNELLWSRGNRNPPHKVEVLAVKIEDKDKTYVKAELASAPKEEIKEETKKKGLVDKLKSSVSVKETEETNKAAEEKKEQLKELKKEEREVMEHAEAPRPKKKTSFKTKEQIEQERERSVLPRDKKAVQHKKPKAE